jgi:hypothetical protein
MPPSVGPPPVHNSSGLRSPPSRAQPSGTSVPKLGVPDSVAKGSVSVQVWLNRRQRAASVKSTARFYISSLCSFLPFGMALGQCGGRSLSQTPLKLCSFCEIRDCCKLAWRIIAPNGQVFPPPVNRGNDPIARKQRHSLTCARHYAHARFACR